MDFLIDVRMSQQLQHTFKSSKYSIVIKMKCIYTLSLVPQLEKLIEKNYYLHKSAQEAYKSYVRAYDSHSLKQIYSVNTLNLPMVALSFGFKVPPYVDLSILCCDSAVPFTHSLFDVLKSICHYLYSL